MYVQRSEGQKKLIKFGKALNILRNKLYNMLSTKNNLDSPMVGKSE